MATTMLAFGNLCSPPNLLAYNLQTASAFAFSKSSLLAPLILHSRAVSAANKPASSSYFCSKSGWQLRLTAESKEADERTPPTAETNILVKLAWYGSEIFGKAVSGFRPKSQMSSSTEEKFEGPIGRKDAVELLRTDLDRSYFVTGNMATRIYEEDCEFADPFVSFKGLKRFKQNVGNLGSFMEESSLKLLDWQEYEDRIYAKWRFNCVIALPWRPILAASGSTEYFFSTDSGKIYKHVESWDISPVDGLRQLFKPNPKKR